MGLNSDPFGSIRLGRIPTATFVSAVNFGAFQDSTNLGPCVLHTFQSPGTQPMITRNGLLDSAWGHSISYSLPTIAAVPGLAASVQVAAGEGISARRMGGGTTYRSDALGATFTFDSVDHGMLPVGAPTAASATPARPVYSANRMRTYQGGTFYELGVVRFWAQANQPTFSSAVASDLILRTCALSATVPLGLSNVIAEWAHTNQDCAGVAQTTRDSGAVGYDLFLSKRTDVYAVSLHDKVTNLNAETGLAAGLRHRF